MSRCFTGFPIVGYGRTQYITPIGLFYKEVGILLGVVSDCEELVGVTWRVSDCEELEGVYLEGI